MSTIAVLINCYKLRRNQLLITIWRQLLVICRSQKLTAIIKSLCTGLTMFKKVIYLIGLLLISMRQKILAIHSVTENNRVLVGHVFQQLQARDWFNCIQACHDEPRCISYNYERAAGANGLCELIDCGVKDLCDRNKSLIYSLGFVFQQIRQSKVSKSVRKFGLQLNFVSWCNFMFWCLFSFLIRILYILIWVVSRTPFQQTNLHRCWKAHNFEKSCRIVRII